MLKLIYQSTVATLALAFLLCGIYPFIVTAIGGVLFHEQASGGIITDSSGNPIGARLIGQAFMKPEYFHGRPSSAGTGYDAANSGGSNLGPTNQKFFDTLKGNMDTVLKDNPTLQKGQIPGDLITASASGLDPHLSPEGALVQVDRVAKARGVSSEIVQRMVKDQIESPQWGIFGEPVVNVLLLNLSLDKLLALKK